MPVPDVVVPVVPAAPDIPLVPLVPVEPVVPVSPVVFLVLEHATHAEAIINAQAVFCIFFIAIMFGSYLDIIQAFLRWFLNNKYAVFIPIGR
jgi:hypothetical protein